MKAAVLSLLAPLTFCAVASAQDVPVPQEFLSNRRESGGDKIRYCLNMSSALVEFDREVGKEIAGALFLQPEFFEVKTPSDPYPLDFRIDLTEEDLFIFLNKRCEAFLGFSISLDDTPDFVIPTHPYHSTRFRLASLDPAVRSMKSLAPASPVGTVMGSSADSDYRVYLLSAGSLPLRRLPYPDNQLLIERLRDRTLAAAILWEPAAYLATHGDPAAGRIHLSDDLPFSNVTVDFGVGIASGESFLRVQLDAAIDALVKDGSIERIKPRFGLPPTKDAPKR